MINALINPSIDPSIDPLIDPSIHPSIHPSIDPSIDPSHDLPTNQSINLSSFTKFDHVQNIVVVEASKHQVVWSLLVVRPKHKQGGVQLPAVEFKLRRILPVDGDSKMIFV